MHVRPKTVIRRIDVDQTAPQYPHTSAEIVIPCALEVGQCAWKLYEDDLINHYEKDTPDHEL